MKGKPKLVEFDLFRQHFRLAVSRNKALAQSFIFEKLPKRTRFEVLLNCSYDGWANPAVVKLFPEDSSREMRDLVYFCDEEQVMTTLWRDEYVPEWVDICVAGIKKETTLIELCCCGRFNKNYDQLYHLQEGYPPFHVHTIRMPASAGFPPDRQKFSVYHQSRCDDLEELKALEKHSERVDRLRLAGSELTGTDLERLSAFKNINHLSIEKMALRGSELSVLSSLPNLRSLSLDLENSPHFDGGYFFPSPTLTSLSIGQIPTGDWGFKRLGGRLGSLQGISLNSSNALQLNGLFPAGLDSIMISAPSIEGRPFPKTLNSLQLQLFESGDAEIESNLAKVRRVYNLDLSSTLVTDRIIDFLLKRVTVERLSVRRTGVTTARLAQAKESHPELSLCPDPNPPPIEEMDWDDLSPEEQSFLSQ
ncbi:MAG: hypothetical protein P1V97_34205 [Planctomycetota bacterium]|nr:hypothetical protein [Planctomycetota bacterium]